MLSCTKLQSDHDVGEQLPSQTMRTHALVQLRLQVQLRPRPRLQVTVLALVLLSLCAAGVPGLQADCALSAPGVAAGSQKATAVPFTKECTLAPCYKFVYNGIEAKGSASGGGGSGNGSSGSGGGGSSNNGNNPSQHSSSYNNGYNSGYNNGCARGYDDGYDDGRYNRRSRRDDDDDDDNGNGNGNGNNGNGNGNNNNNGYGGYSNNGNHWGNWAWNSYNAGYYAGYECGYGPNYERGYSNGCNKNSTGSVTFKCTVSDNRPVPTTKSCSIQFKNVNEFNGSTVTNGKLSPVCVYKATTVPIVIKLTWKGEGSAPKPNGNVTILGEFQKDPPPPTGSLNFGVGDLMLQVEGGATQPEAVAKIVRE